MRRTKIGIAELVGAVTASLVVLFAATMPAFAEAEAGVERLSFSNGVSAILYTAPYFDKRLTELNGQPAFRLDDGRFIPVIIEISDPAIYNKGDGSFHPFEPQLVEAVLSALVHPSLRLSVHVYLLPYPRRTVVASATNGVEIFLCPHVLAIEPAVGAYIVTHELGHAFHNRFLPDQSEKWTEYRRLRGITDGSRFRETSSHAYRPKEIFAEDFRVLFGGVDARMDGRIENTDLASPETVGGLKEFFVRAAAMEPWREPKSIATSVPDRLSKITPGPAVRERAP